ncbi:histidine kinase [Streptomyces albiflavescens]|uniref:Histidine kinase n=1 Tax=Streptomyces albiflavescens TaxID=1623582 RepID=A0A917Y3I4_9ACTN|nr:ATP-binding protein [Streptomyces albiflavescens]GGN64757.1 histidine kinase [Streptomyces albiflavescens]
MAVGHADQVTYYAAPTAAAPDDRAFAPDARLGSYLQAAVRAADHHPYPGLTDAASSPPLTELYVHQQAQACPQRAIATADLESDAHSSAQYGWSTQPVPAESIFAGDSRVRVLLAGAGGGKSTLLRRHLADSANQWLRDEGSDRGSNTGSGQGSEEQRDQRRPAVPVLIRATSLVGTALLAQALATAVTEELGPFGLREALPEDFFRRCPSPLAPWLVMVDGLDEVPNLATRVALLERLAREAETEPLLYRFIVATRPLPGRELDRLGPSVSRLELRPFSPPELHEYATKCFRDLPGADQHTSAFTSELKRSCLDDLARTPLIASMLCQLYAADPSKPLPEGRTGAYRSFVELLYEQNTHKSIAKTHTEVILALKDRHQIPRDSQAAEHAAQLVRNQLAELIDHLAHERINGNTAPTVEILASHLSVRRPDKIKGPLWNAFLSDLLRPTGLLAERAGDFDFFHQTLLEYHAARHATRDEDARTQLLHRLFPRLHAPESGYWVPPGLDPSYLGFLLDGLLTPDDHVRADTIRALEHLSRRGREPAYSFLLKQIQLRTVLPPEDTARQLARFADGDTLLDPNARAGAARTLAGMYGHREQGVELLARLAGDTTLRDALMDHPQRLHGYQHRWDVGIARVRAAFALAKLGDERAAGLLADLAHDGTVRDARLQAALALATMNGHRKEGTDLLARFVTDTSWESKQRVTAARALAALGDGRAVRLLALLAVSTTVNPFQRATAALRLAGMDGHQEEGTALLARLASAGRGIERVSAAWARAKLGDERAAGLLADLAANASLGGVRRDAALALALLGDERAAGLLAHFHDAETARALARMDGHREEGVALLARLASTGGSFDRLTAAIYLANLDHGRAAEVLTRFTANTRMEPFHRVKAAWILYRLAGHAEEGAALLAALAADPTMGGIREHATEALTHIGGISDAFPDRRTQ